LMVRTIENGVSIPDFAPLPAAHRNGAVMLCRICPEKGTHIGIAAARKAGVPLTIAGRAFGYPEHVAYFNRHVLPALNAHTTFLGPLGRSQKLKLLQSASCLLLPSLAPETSSLVSMEALACGTPVIAMRSGTLPDIIEHGKTGFLVNSADEMADAIGLVHHLEPAICRRVAIERFSADRMVREYLRLYEQLITREESAVHTGLRRTG